MPEIVHLHSILNYVLQHKRRCFLYIRTFLPKSNKIQWCLLTFIAQFNAWNRRIRKLHKQTKNNKKKQCKKLEICKNVYICLLNAWIMLFTLRYLLQFIFLFMFIFMFMCVSFATLPPYTIRLQGLSEYVYQFNHLQLSLNIHWSHTNIFTWISYIKNLIIWMVQLLSYNLHIRIALEKNVHVTVTHNLSVIKN